MALRPALRHVLISAVLAAQLVGCGSRGDTQPSDRADEVAASPVPQRVEPQSAPPASRESQPSAPVQAAPPAAAPRSAPAAAEARLSVAEAQRKLTDLGYRPGAIDGVMGVRTAAALREFQRDQGLRQSGQIDTESNQRLRAAQPR